MSTSTCLPHSFISHARTLPLTGEFVVQRLITDLAVMDITPQGLWLKEIVPQVNFEALQKMTGVKLLSAPDLRPYAV